MSPRGMTAKELPDAWPETQPVELLNVREEARSVIRAEVRRALWVIVPPVVVAAAAMTWSAWQDRKLQLAVESLERTIIARSAQPETR